MHRPSPRSSAVLAFALLPIAAAHAIPPEPPRTLPAYAVLALEDLRTKGMDVTGGAIGVNAGMLYAHGPIRAAGQAVVADMVRIHEASTCSELWGNDVMRNGPDCGPGQAFASPILADPVGACGVPVQFPACDPNHPVSVTAGATTHLAPGVYGELFVDGGPVSGTLLLDGGAYVFCSVKVGRNGRILADTAAEVTVTGRTTIGPHTVVGPTTGSGLPPMAFRLLSNDTSVRFARQSEVHAQLCAPDALLRVTAGSLLDGVFMARAVHTEHITVHGDGRGGNPRGSTTTTTTLPDASTTTSTTVPGASTTSTTLAGATTTTTSVPGSTTTTTEPCSGDGHCGNGVVDCGEVCDPQAPPIPCDPQQPNGPTVKCVDACSAFDTSACPGGTTTTTTLPGATTTTTTSAPSTTTTTTAPCVGPCPETTPEQCDNCEDDDGDGLIDFEDPDCCGTAPVSVATVHRGRMMPRPGHTSRLVLRTTAGMMPAYTPHPMQQDVTLQIRSKTTGTELLCARVPAMKFMKRGKQRVGFWDYRHHVVTARGVDDMTFRYRKDGQVRVRVLGKRAQFTASDTDDFMITLGAMDPGDPSQNLCSAVVQRFVAHKTKAGKTKRLW